MAEMDDFPVARGATLTVTDASGTPKTYTFKVRAQSYTMTRGGYDEIRQRDSNGDLGDVVKLGNQSGPSTMAFDLHVNDPGDNASEAVGIDFVLRQGYVASTWATTGSAYSGVKQFTLALALPSTGGVVVTYTMPKSHLKTAATVTLTPEGWVVPVVWESASQITEARV